MEEKNYQAIVTHFGDLGALQQLPGLAIQRLMEKGYGFGGEGDWKTAAMVRVMKIMTQGIKDAKGTSFMEDYTYNLVPGKEGVPYAEHSSVCLETQHYPDAINHENFPSIVLHRDENFRSKTLYHFSTF